METKLIRIAEITKENPKEVFTSLYHYLNKEMLIQCHKGLAGNKAAGIDEMTKAEYDTSLDDNVNKLVERLKKHSYKPQAVKRVYIPKGDGKEKRPLGIAAYEDKIVWHLPFLEFMLYPFVLAIEILAILIIYINSLLLPPAITWYIPPLYSSLHGLLIEKSSWQYFYPNITKRAIICQ